MSRVALTLRPPERVARASFGLGAAPLALLVSQAAGSEPLTALAVAAAAAGASVAVTGVTGVPPARFVRRAGDER